MFSHALRDGDLDADVRGDVRALLLALRDGLGGLDGFAPWLGDGLAHLLGCHLAVLPDEVKYIKKNKAGLEKPTKNKLVWKKPQKIKLVWKKLTKKKNLQKRKTYKRKRWFGKLPTKG